MTRYENYIMEDSPFLLYEKLTKGSKTKISNTNIKLLTLTNRKDDESNKDNLFRTAQRIADICKVSGIEQYTVFAESAYILREGERITIHNFDDPKGFDIDKDDTVAIIRGSIGRYLTSLNLVSQLERIGIFCVNTRETIEVCSDKYRTMLKIVDSGLPSPKTALVQSMDTLKYALEVVDNKFPLIVKTLKGSKGVGVFFVESLRSLNSILQTIWKINEDEELLLQQYIDIPYDLRVHILGDKVIASMKRFIIEDDFRSNFSLGGKVEPTTISKEEEEICVLAAKAVGATWAAVDLVKDKKGNPYIIEVNSSPGTEGIEKAIKKDLVGMVIDYVTKEENWVKVSKECGFLEYIEIDGIGKFKAKFDTGNGSLCVLHSDKYEIDEKKQSVTWYQGENKYTHGYKTIKEVRVGGLRDYVEKRPVIELDIIFDGVIHKAVDITLDDRNDRTPVLINRRFMRKANIMINPAKKYLLSKEEE